MTAELFLAGLCALLLVQLLAVHHSLWRALRGAPWPPPLKRYPSVTVIRPIKGVDAGLRDNILAALHTGYPGQVQTVFVFDDSSDPALPVVVRQLREQARVDSAVKGAQQEARRRRRSAAQIMFCGDPPPNRTGKQHAMIHGLKGARGEVIVFADSDIRPDGLALTVLVETLLQSPDTGSAFAPVVATEPPRTLGDAGYALLLNGLYGAAAARAARRGRGTLPFIMGQLMAFRRSTLAAIGGIEAAQGQLVDDMYLGSCVHAVGLRNRVSPRAVPVIQHGLGLREFFATYRRWITFSRSGLPGLAFKLTPMLLVLTFWAGLALAAAASALGSVLGLAGAALVMLGVGVSITALHVAVGGAPLALRHRATAWLLLLAAPLVLVTIHLNWTVTWRGRQYQLDSSSRLADGAPSGRPDVPPERPAQPTQDMP